MRLPPTSDGPTHSHTGAPRVPRDGLAPPTVSGMATAAATVLLLACASVLLVVPNVFYLVPMPSEVDGITLCLPGLGPLIRVRANLTDGQEELAYLHEGVHAAQCRSFGALWYASQNLTPGGRLRLEAQALCAEAALLSRRGIDGDRLVDRAVAGLVSHYFEGGEVAGWEVVAAVGGACDGVAAAPEWPDA